MESIQDLLVINKMDYIISILGMYVASLLFSLGSHALLCSIDVELYKNNKYNEHKKIVKIGFKWLFWRSRKDNEKEIFYLVFIHEVINLLLAVASIVCMIISILDHKNSIILIALILDFAYFCYVILLNYVTKKR